MTRRSFLQCLAASTMGVVAAACGRLPTKEKVVPFTEDIPSNKARYLLYEDGGRVYEWSQTNKVFEQVIEETARDVARNSTIAFFGASRGC